MPWTLREAILQRIVALPETAQQVLRLAAVIGRRVPRPLLVAVATRSDLPEERVLEALEDCGRGRLLTESAEDACLLTHDLIREVLLADLGIARRAILHRRVAEVLEAGPGVPSMEVLAYHCAHSGMTDKAAGYLERAADAARARYAYAEAIEAYQEVITRLEALDQAESAARVREKLGEVLTLQGHYDQALEVVEAAAAWYRLAGDQESQQRALAQLETIHHLKGGNHDST